MVPVEELTGKHLVAEYRELPRVFALAYKAIDRNWMDGQPLDYKLGSGHVYFFYDKLNYLSDRHQQLVAEMIKRGYHPQMTESLEAQWRDKIPDIHWKNYTPTKNALRLNRERIADRLGTKEAQSFVYIVYE